MDANWKDKGLRGDMRRGCVRGEGKGRVRSAQLGGGELLIANLLDSYTAPSTPTHTQTHVLLQLCSKRLVKLVFYGIVYYLTKFLVNNTDWEGSHVALAYTNHIYPWMVINRSK